MRPVAPPVSLRALVHDRRGAVGIYFALIMTIMALLSVAALDLIRAHMVRARMALAADSAILAAGRSLGEANWQNVGAAFFNANMEDALGPKVTIGRDNFETVNNGLGVSTVTLNLETTVPMMSAGLGNISSLRMSISATAERRIQTVEMAMVLDNTGSMLTNDNIGALRRSAINLLNIMANNEPNTLPSSRIAVVPYSAAVNAGSIASRLVSSVTYAPSDPLGWHGCVIEPPAPNTLSITPAVGAGWRAYQAPNAVDNNYTPGKASTVKGDWSYGNGSTGPNVGCPTAITPLTSNINTLRGALNAMQAWSRGGTLSDIGMAWGGRVLSPAATFQPAGATPPVAWNTANVRKVVVLMTDGQANFNKLSGTAGDNKENSAVESDYTGYGRLDQYGLVGASTRAAGIARVEQNLANLCAAMRGPLGVQVYTITFGNLNSTTTNLYRSCAYQDSFYFNAPSQSALDEAFRSIGGSLSELRIIR